MKSFNYLVLMTMSIGLSALGSQTVVADANWTSAGHDIRNTRHQENETRISTSTVANLAVKWVFSTGGDVSATPAVDGKNVYFPDWVGNLYALSRKTGAVVWEVSIPAVTGIPGDLARATPVITDGKVIVGTQGSGELLAFDKNTGGLIWSTVLDTHPAAVVTQSATVQGTRIFVGVASIEEYLAGIIPGYPCCSFQGSMLALDVDTGAILWKTYMAPEGYSGNGVWGSAPAVDVRRGQVYIATGNNYSVPVDVLDCVAAAGEDPDAKEACIAGDNHFDSIVALDMQTGEIRWSTRALPYDAWTADCIPFFGDGDNCPYPAGPGYDFGQAPALFTATLGGMGRPRDLVGAGQKSGQYWVLDPDTGAVVWVTQAGPGGSTGGLQWGSAVDGNRVYTANANSDLVPWTLPDGTVTTAGFWSGLDNRTGEILWQSSPIFGGMASGPTTIANDVMFGCTLDPQGHMYALDGRTGEILWAFPSGGSCLSGAAISKGEVYWGSGYSNFGYGTANNKLYAFEVL